MESNLIAVTKAHIVLKNLSSFDIASVSELLHSSLNLVWNRNRIFTQRVRGGELEGWVSIRKDVAGRLTCSMSERDKLSC